MRRQWLVTGLCLVVFLAAVPAFAIPANDKGGGLAPEAEGTTFTANVLEWKNGSLTLQRDSGEVVILALDDAGISLHVDRDVVKGSRVQVSEERNTNMNSIRTFVVKLAPPPAK